MRTALLLSGGVDSAAVAWWRRPEFAYTIHYGQAAADAEIEAAASICKVIRCKHVILRVDASTIGSGLMAGKRSSRLSRHPEWWPFRNQFLATVAGMQAVQQNVQQLIIGTVRSDSRHRDGKAMFVANLDLLMRVQEGGLRFKAPAIAMTAPELINKAKLPQSILMRTHSCHKGNTHCCSCPGCFKRLQVFKHFELSQ